MKFRTSSLELFLNYSIRTPILTMESLDFGRHGYGQNFDHVTTYMTKTPGFSSRGAKRQIAHSTVKGLDNFLAPAP